MKFTVAIDRTIGRTIYRWHVRLYRLTRGVIGHKSPLGPIMILETRGRKSGLTRSVTLLYYEKATAFFVVASNGGRPGHPEWLLNLRTHPDVDVQIGARTFAAIARRNFGANSCTTFTDGPTINPSPIAPSRSWSSSRRRAKVSTTFHNLPSTTTPVLSIWYVRTTRVD